jgi:hypothetical protein
MSKLTISCVDWRPLRKGSLLGFAKVRVVEMDMTFIDVAVHVSHGKLWAAPPARPWVKDGQVVTDDSHKVQYSAIVEFGRKETRDAFSAAVVDAVRRFDPRALGDAENVA